MNYIHNHSLKESNGLSNIDGERFDGGSALDWNNSKVHLQNLFQANECWEYVCPHDPIPLNIEDVLENEFTEVAPVYSVMVTDRIAFMEHAITERMDDREATLAEYNLAAAVNNVEAYRIQVERSSELAKLEQNRDGREKDFMLSRDAWQKRKERHLLIQSKCMTVFVKNLGESPRSIIKDLLAAMKFRAAWVKLIKTYASNLGNQQNTVEILHHLGVCRLDRNVKPFRKHIQYMNMLFDQIAQYEKWRSTVLAKY